MPTIFEIDKATAEYAAAYMQLRNVIEILERDLDAIKKKQLRGIRVNVREAAKKKAMLEDLLRESPELFEKPKTMILHGIRVGFRKGAGKIDWDDDARVVALIRKHFPDWAETLIRVKESPIVAGLNELEVKDLRKIGVTAESTGDEVVIKPVAGDIDKLVDALLREDKDPEAA